MAITLYSGPPGAGKSYALVEQTIVPGVMQGRRVLTNVEGVDPAAVYRYCAERAPDPSSLGEVVIFDGRESIKPRFFPTQDIPDSETFVKGGDLIVFDEWRLYWPRRGKLPSDELEPFLRWHRHLTGPDGRACDVVIGTQLSSDVHQDFRGLIERSFKFKKLKAVGLDKAFAWDVFEGHLQPKGGAYDTGNGTYKSEIYELYSSYSGVKSAVEARTDKRSSIWKTSVFVMIGVCVPVFGLSVWGIYNFFSPALEDDTAVAAAGGALPSVAGVPVAGVPVPARSPFRIVGQIEGDAGVRVIVMGQEGQLRIMQPAEFRFDGDRAVAGFVDGAPVVAEDRVALDRPPMAMLPGMIP